MVTVLDQAVRWTATLGGVDAVQLPRGPLRAAEHFPVVVFDGDDTLWETEHLYDNARELAAKVVADAGLDPIRWDDVQRRRDVENVDRFGLSAERFPTSCVEAFVQVALENGIPVRTEDIEDVRAAAASVFDAKAPVDPSARAVLTELRKSYRLVLLTQGDPRVQSKRVSDSGLAELFDDIVVVAVKSSGVLRAIAEEFSIPCQDSWMVGNSLPSDVGPAIAAGMRAVWIDAHVWDHERRHADIDWHRVTIASRLSEVPEIIAAR